MTLNIEAVFAPPAQQEIRQLAGAPGADISSETLKQFAGMLRSGRATFDDFESVEEGLGVIVTFFAFHECKENTESP